MTVRLGLYKHFRASEYRVLAVARHSETLEELVVYRALYESADFGKGAEWVRPVSIFTKPVPGADAYRFVFIG